MHTPFSDHSAIMLKIQSFDQGKKPGPGFWKFNTSLLEDKEYVEKMRQNIPAFIEKHKDVLDLGLKLPVPKFKIVLQNECWDCFGGCALIRNGCHTSSVCR